MNIGKRIRNLRNAKDLGVTELANKSFISQSYLSDIEAGRTTPSLDKLSIICNSLGISLSDFFGGTSELPASLIRLLKNAEKLTEDEIELLSNFLEAILKRNNS